MNEYESGFKALQYFFQFSSFSQKLGKKLSGLIYQVPCADCNLIYIVQTKQTLKLLQTENKHCIKNQILDQSVFCEHLMIMDHKIDWENTIILK